MSVCDISYPYKLLCCKSYSCDCWLSWFSYACFDKHSHKQSYPQIPWYQPSTGLKRKHDLGITGSNHQRLVKKAPRNLWGLRQLTLSNWCQRWKSFVRAAHSRSFSKWQRSKKNWLWWNMGWLQKEINIINIINQLKWQIPLFSLSHRVFGGCSPRWSEVEADTSHFEFDDWSIPPALPMPYPAW